MRRSRCFAMSGFATGHRRRAFAVMLAVAATPSATFAAGPAPELVAPWLEAHRRIEHGTGRPAATELAAWLQAHLEREYDVAASELAGQLHRHVLRENAV